MSVGILVRKEPKNIYKLQIFASNFNNQKKFYSFFVIKTDLHLFKYLIFNLINFKKSLLKTHIFS